MGRQTKKLNLIAAAIIMAVLLLPLTVAPVYAADPPAPANLQFESAKVYHHLLETDDFALAFHFNIHYAVEDQPDEPANKLFTFRLLDTNGIDHLGAIVPYAFYNAGYDQGCALFYFPEADAPDWEQGYVLRISGNPEYFGTPPVASRTLVTSDYSQMDTQEENQTLLGNYILDVARDLEINWDAELLYVGDLGTVLNSTGEAYFRGAITGLQVMVPQIFPVQTTNPEYVETEWTQAQGELYTNRFEDSWVGESLVSFGEQFHVKWNVITGILTLGVIIALAVFCQWKYSTVKPVFLGGPIVMLGGTVMGWFAPAIMAIVAVFMALFLGYVWMFRHG